ncbi:hypothetical protein CU254_14190 [Amycolatopsis sp. AA4]|uniref:hypothetical protein n=1 Tax=Actinomycetes TaxID=1760 RepID=UPI0001B53A5B|nr:MULTISPECIES: hypothetical protein [Actinomycetes]ATY11483.1 hypothetical protein CU254_14190 [Amycolatopsis sp. AA4]EFL07111.1 predicted protein [Streptomyces sp. AA4]
MIRPVQNRLLLSYGTVAVALACTACSGSGSTAAQPPAGAAVSSPVKPSDAPPDAATIGDTVKAAMKKSAAVHVKGKDGTTKIDVQLNKDSAGGSIEQDGSEIPVVRVGDKVWIKFTRGMAKLAGRPAGARSPLDGKWVSMDSPMTKGLGEGVKLFVDRDFLVGAMAEDLDQPGYSAAEPADVAGAPALKYRNGSRTMFLEAAGSHRLLRYESPEQGTMEFSGWDDSRPVEAPPAAEIYSGS